MTNKDLDIFDSVKSEIIKDLTPEILETTFDLITKSELIKEIPIFGIGFKTYSIYQNITESFFVKKILKFLYELKDISYDKREEFIKNLETKKETAKAGEKLLIILNRLNDIEKAKIIGKLFNNTILEKISFEDFDRLTHIIDNAYINDLKSLKNNPHLSYLDNSVKSNLYILGLLNQSIPNLEKKQKSLKRVYIKSSTDSLPLPNVKLEYKPNKYCDLLIKYGFE